MSEIAAPALKTPQIKYITPDCVDGKRIKVLVIGEAGVGKTSLLRTIPEDESVFTISAEGGLLSVNDMLQAGKIKGVVINSFPELNSVFDHLKTDWLPKFSWVFIDSLSELAAQCFSIYHQKFGDNTYALWPNYYEAFWRMVRRFRDLPKYNIVFTSLLAHKEVNKITKYFPMVIGDRMQTVIPGEFDELFYMEVNRASKAKRRVFHTNSGGRYPAKDRSGKLNSTEPAHLGYIRDKILNIG
jgi:hypothetical protein